MTNEDKFLNFQTSTMEAARKESSSVIDEYKKTLNEKLENQKDSLKRIAKMQIKAEGQNLTRQKNKVISSEQLHIRQILTQKNNELKEKLFSEVQTLLTSFLASADYDQLLIRQIKKDLAFANGDAIIIYLDPNDASKQSALEAATGASLIISEYSFGGGTRAVIEHRHILIDDSFQTKLEEAYNGFSFKGGLIHE